MDDFLQALINFDKEHIPDATVRVLKEGYLSDPDFNPEFVRLKSSAAAGLCAWVINIIRFHEVTHTHTQTWGNTLKFHYLNLQQWLNCFGFI